MEWEDGMEGERGSGREGGTYRYDERLKVAAVSASTLVSAPVPVPLTRGCKSESLPGQPAGSHPCNGSAVEKNDP